MKNIRIYTLARELKLSNAEVINLARALGANVGTASSAISEAIATSIREQKSDAKRTQPSRAQGQQKAPAHAKPAPVEAEKTPESDPEPAPPPRPQQSRQRPTQQREPRGGRRKPVDSPPIVVAEVDPDTDSSSSPSEPPQSQTRGQKRLYLVDGLNVCNWQKTPSLAPLLTLLIDLKRQGHQFLCIFDANTRFVLDDLGERDKYEHLLNKYDCFGEVPGGMQADDFLLFRAHKTGDAIVTNDQYRDQKYRERYKWLRSVSPRLFKGMVLGGFLILPELNVHAKIRESVSGVVKDFEDAFGTGAHRERQPDHRQPHGAHRNQPRSVSQPRREAPVPRPPSPPKPVETPPEPVPIALSTHSSVEASAPVDPAAAAAGEQRPRSRRRRRRGRRGGGGGGGGQEANGNSAGSENPGNQI